MSASRVLSADAGENPESIFDASGVYEVKLIEDNVMARRE